MSKCICICVFFFFLQSLTTRNRILKKTKLHNKLEVKLAVYYKKKNSRITGYNIVVPLDFVNKL